MSDVSFNSAQGPSSLTPLDNNVKVGASATTNSSMPNAKGLDPLSMFQGPTLAAPEPMSLSAMSSLSTDCIMAILGTEERQNAVESGIESIKGHADEKARINQEIIDSLNEQSEKIKEKANMSAIQKIFSYIGMALGALASIGSIILGVCTGNPALVAGGVIGLVCTVDSIMSAASDGDVCFAGMCGAIADATGGDVDLAKSIGGYVMMAAGIAGALTSMAGGIQTIVKEGASNAAKIVGSIMSTSAAALGGATDVAQGAMSIKIAGLEYDAQCLKANSKVLDAVLERLQASQEMDETQLQGIMDKFNKMTQGLTDIVNQCAEAATSVATGNAMA